MNRKPETAILLDIDGVILPNLDDSPMPESNENSRLERVWLNQFEYYYPEVLRALAEVATRSAIILSSSRQLGFLAPHYREITEPLGMNHSLHIDPYRPAHIGLKYDAVRRFVHRIGDEGLDILERSRGHLLNGSGVRVEVPVERVVWVDDHIPKLGYYGNDEELAEQREAELLRDDRIAIVTPRSMTGLTLRGVEEIRQHIEKTS